MIGIDEDIVDDAVTLRHRCLPFSPARPSRSDPTITERPAPRIGHDPLMIVMRTVWILLALVAVLLGIEAATSPMLQITGCETGLYSREVPNIQSCNNSILSYFGTVVVPALAVPVAVCLMPVFTPRPQIAWLATAALFGLSFVGFSALLLSPKPSALDLYGFFWPAALLAVPVTGLAQVVSLRRRGPTGRSVQRSWFH